MITKSELKEYARLKHLNLGQAEKEYFMKGLAERLFLKIKKILH